METESSLTPGEALYVVERLLAERRVSAADIHRYLSQLSDEIRRIEARLDELWEAEPVLSLEEPPSLAPRRLGARRSTGRRTRQARPPVSPFEAVASASVPLPKERRKRRRSSPAIVAKMRLIGSFVGYIRQVPQAKRPGFQRIAKQQGYEAAIEAIRVHLRK
jgi:hypothetical protein